MKARTHILKVLMNGILVGQLEKNTQGIIKFSYDDSWLNLPGALPISLSLPMLKQVYTGTVVNNFLDNLLPDKPQLRTRIQQTYQIKTDQPFDLLAKIGKDCPGAIQIVKNQKIAFQRKIFFLPMQKHTIADRLRNISYYPLGMQENEDEDDFRISLAGVQDKTAFLLHQNKWGLPLQSTPTTHIFKLPIGTIEHQRIDLIDSCENEWLCSRIAEGFGIPVTKCEIAHFEDVKVLVVERFDRQLSKDGKWIIRLPQEDICQALGISPNLKYQADGGPGIKDIMKLLLGSDNAMKDRDTFYRSQVLFWLLAAIDGHAKNFSLFIESGGKYRLAPLYDILSVYPLFENKQLHERKVKMAMALIGKNIHYQQYNINRRHFLQTADFANYSTHRAQQILDEMLQQVDSVITQVSAKLPANFPKKISRPIFDGMRSMKLRLLK